MLAHTDAYPGLPAMRDGTAAPGTSPELLSFGDRAAVATGVREEITGAAYAADDDVRYVWPTVRDHLTRCGVLIGPSAVEIRPYHPLPIAASPSSGGPNSAAGRRRRQPRQMIRLARPRHEQE